MKWFAEVAPHAQSGGDFSWRAGCVRRAGDYGFAACYYEATLGVHRRLFDSDKKLFNEFRDAEGLRRKGRKTLLYPASALGDPFIMVGDFRDHYTSREVLGLRQYHVSFEHAAQHGFLGRVCENFARADLRVIQHDAYMCEAPSGASAGKIQHAFRCYMSVGMSNEIIQRKVEESVVGAAEGSWTGTIEYQEPSPRKGIRCGDIELKDYGKEAVFGYLSLMARLPAKIPEEEMCISSLEYALDLLLPATETLGRCADIAETATNGSRVERPIVRSIMRTLGGYCLLTICVPLSNVEEVEALERVANDLNEEKHVRAEDFIPAQVRWSPKTPPWSCPEGRPKGCLPKLRHNDRPGYLADYFAFIGEDLTEKVSVIQYDSFAQRGGGAAHQLSLCVTDPKVSLKEGRARIEEWFGKHEEWQVREEGV